ncbi:MAG TPA: ATP-binding protein [Rhodoferax sp.]|nr:ATP-binding protein [Rhodoferax sp.]
MKSGKYKCTLVKHCEPGLPKMRCIAAQLNQVFLNLLVNAANAIGTSGDITITTQSLIPGAIRISISETGCGIPTGNRQRIFDQFFTTKPVGQGTGLGLSIVCGIVRKHYGKIDVESTVGRGSTFVLTLPVDPPA